jgi:hypothetical protein
LNSFTKLRLSVVKTRTNTLHVSSVGRRHRLDLTQPGQAALAFLREQMALDWSSMSLDCPFDAPHSIRSIIRNATLGRMRRLPGYSARLNGLRHLTEQEFLALSLSGPLAVSSVDWRVLDSFDATSSPCPSPEVDPHEQIVLGYVDGIARLSITLFRPSGRPNWCVSRTSTTQIGLARHLFWTCHGAVLEDLQLVSVNSGFRDDRDVHVLCTKTDPPMLFQLRLCGPNSRPRQFGALNTLPEVLAEAQAFRQTWTPHQKGMLQGLIQMGPMSC